MQLNSLVKNVEYYKLTHGKYPDSLQQLLDDDKLTPINDAAQGFNSKGTNYYNYQKSAINIHFFHRVKMEYRIHKTIYTLR